MTPDEQAAERIRLTSMVEQLRAKSESLNMQIDMMSKRYAELSDQRSDARRQHSDAARLVRALSHKIRELLRNLEDDPESKTALEAARAEYEAAVKAQVRLSALSNVLQDRLVQASDERSAVRRERQMLLDEISAVSVLQREASRGKPMGNDAEQREKATQVIRETFALMEGKEMQWGDNPFHGQPVTTSGSINKEGPNFRIYYDSQEYHAMMSIVKDQRAMHIFDAAGNVLFEGPVNRLTDLTGVSQDIFYLWEYMATRITINGR